MLLNYSSGANKTKQNTRFIAHNFVGQEFRKGSAGHFLAGGSRLGWSQRPTGATVIVIGTLSWTALDSQDGSLTQLAPGPRCGLVALLQLVNEVPTSNAAESWRAVGLFTWWLASPRMSVPREKGRNYTAFLYLALEITNSHFRRLLLVISYSLSPAQNKAEETQTPPCSKTSVKTLGEVIKLSQYIAST